MKTRPERKSFDLLSEGVNYGSSEIIIKIDEENFFEINDHLKNFTKNGSSYDLKRDRSNDLLLPLIETNGRTRIILTNKLTIELCAAYRILLCTNQRTLYQV